MFAKQNQAPPAGIAIGIVFSVLCYIIVAKVERRRLHWIRDQYFLDKPYEIMRMSTFPQFMLLADVVGLVTRVSRLSICTKPLNRYINT